MVSKVDAAKELLKRREARRSLLSFIQYINPDYIVSDFSRTVCAELEQFLHDCLDGKRPVLILEAPPQHGKSDMVSRYLPAFIYGHYNHFRLAGLSYSKDLASDMNRDVQAIMSTQEYKNLFPKSWMGNGTTVANSDKFKVPNGTGTYSGQGVGGPLTGKRVDIGIIDDPIKNSQEALSETIKESIWKWYGSTFLTRLSKNSGHIIMATRWAVDDLSGRVLANNPKAKRLSFPAVNEQGEALIPELHPIEKLLETKQALGDYFWSAMYQGSPKNLGGNVFKDEYVQYYLPKDLPEKFEKVIASWDCTFKDTDGTDYVVGQVWGKQGANSYLLAQRRERMSFTKTVTAVVDLKNAHPRIREILIEDKANGPAVIDTLKSTVQGIIPIEPDGSKLARAHAVTSYWEARNIWLPHPDIAPWVNELVSELTTFPAAANDDQVDAMSQALRRLYPLHGRITINQDALRRAMGR